MLPVLMLLAVTACGGGGGSDTGSDGDKGKGSARTASDKTATKASEACGRPIEVRPTHA